MTAEASQHNTDTIGRRLWPPRLTDGGQPGQVLLWVALMLPFFLAIAGLAIDGGELFAARRQAQNVADAAARAGAQQIDVPHYRTTSEVILDRAAARYEARQYITDLGGLDATIFVTDQSVTVIVRRDVPLTFLQLVGLSSISIEARAVAEPMYGIDEATH
jgi:uncharacterized membrane protein